MARVSSKLKNRPRPPAVSRRTVDWQVSDLAAEFGINPRTVRYYDRIGLLKAATRTPGGYRVYTNADRDRLAFILKAKATGFTLGEIRSVLSSRDKGIAPCPEVLTLVDDKLRKIDERVQALLEFREELLALQHEASGGAIDGCVCGLIEQHHARHEPSSLRLATELLSHRPARARRR